MVTLNMHDFVFVTLKANAPKFDRNHQIIPGSEQAPVTLSWNSREYTLEPGKKVYVQLEAATNAFGDPRSAKTANTIPIGDPSSGERLFIPDREAEVRRLRARYGILDGDDSTFYDMNGVYRVPIVEMETMNGEPITTVLSDPTGDSVNTVIPTVTQAQDTQLTIEHMRQQIEALTKLVEDRNSANPAPSLDQLPSDTDESEEDNPPSTSPDLSALFPSNEEETFDTLPGDET